MNIRFLIAFSFTLFLYNKALFCQKNPDKQNLLQDFFKIHENVWCSDPSPEDYLTDSIKLLSATNYISDSTNIYSYSMMMQIQKHHHEVYESINDSIKIMQYYAYLKHCHCSDHWTWLTLKEQKDNKTANSILSLGKKILPYLKVLMYDTRRTTICNSTEGTTLTNGYIHRIKDFAYRYASLILGEKPIFLKTPEKRDVIIDAFIKKYPQYFGNR